MIEAQKNHQDSETQDPIVAHLFLYDFRTMSYSPVAFCGFKAPDSGPSKPYLPDMKKCPDCLFKEGNR